MSRRIAIITDEPGWHGRRLLEALARHDCRGEYLSLRDCGFDLADGIDGLRLPGFERLPDGVFVRGVPGGSLEQVVHYLDVLHALQRLGVTVYNDGRAIERSVDKGMTSFLLHTAGVATPPAWVGDVDSRAWRAALQVLESGGELVLKPLFGSQGRGVMRISRPQQLPPASQYNGVYYLQRYVESGPRDSHDWRVFVVGGKAVAAMRRASDGWIHNAALGSQCQPAVLDQQLRGLAESACAALDMNYAGVDIIRDCQGEAFVIEVNSIPAWRRLQRVCAVDIAACLIDDFMAACARGGGMEAVG